MEFPRDPVKNILIESLSVNSRNRLLKQSTYVELKFGTSICEANQPYRFVYFPLTAFISLMTVVADHPPLEIGLVGNEGMLGVTVLLGVKNAPLQAIVQGTGTALRIPLAEFRRELLKNPGLVNLLNRYVYILMQQLAQATICIHFHDLNARLCRWLLTINDCTHGDVFHLTHAYLAQMLGVRRSGVSIAASELRRNHLISYSRGKIKILDRQSLEASSCPCYTKMKRFYSKQIHT